jgi:hypothetical protein
VHSISPPMSNLIACRLSCCLPPSPRGRGCTYGRKMSAFMPATVSFGSTAITFLKVRGPSHPAGVCCCKAKSMFRPSECSQALNGPRESQILATSHHEYKFRRGNRSTCEIRCTCIGSEHFDHEVAGDDFVLISRFCLFRVVIFTILVMTVVNHLRPAC